MAPRSTVFSIAGPPKHLAKAPLSALQEPDILPTTQSQSLPHQARSHFFIGLAFAFSIYGAWYLGLDMLQSGPSAGALQKGAAVLLLSLSGLCLTGGFDIEWVELVLGWWWIVMPVMLTLCFTVIVVQEKMEGLEDVT